MYSLYIHCDQLKGYVPSQRDLCDFGLGVMEYWGIGVTPNTVQLKIMPISPFRDKIMTVISQKSSDLIFSGRETEETNEFYLLV